MAATDAIKRPAVPGRSRRLTIRTRLTLTFAGLVIGCGAVLIALVYLYMRFVPRYEIQSALRLEPTSATDGFDTSPSTDITAINSVDDFLANLLIASGVALVVLAALGGTLGWIMARRIVKPLALINTAASRASAGALDHRVGIGGPQDEIRDLSDTFDRMLASLERSFTAHRRFAANASHELRTPLATIKTMTDVALAETDPDTRELRAVLDRIREVNRSNIDTVDALLDLASADGAMLASQPIDLVALVHAVVEMSCDYASQARVSLAILTPPVEATMRGNAVLLERAIDNLVRNAITYNQPGGAVTLNLDLREDTAALITVINTGAIMAKETVDALVEPFVRGAGRSRTTGSGHGLGLALSSAVAHAHGGTLTLLANPSGGLTASLLLPRDAGRECCSTFRR